MRKNQKVKNKHINGKHLNNFENKFPEISVIMPVYNTREWVGDAIESILNQTFKNFEFIIIDDYSTDGSYEICKEYAKKDTRIRLYRNEKNFGVAFTKIRLISLITTDYIASQDSDDISCNNRLEIEYSFLKNHKDYAVVSGNNIIIDERGDVIGHRIYSDDIRNVILKKSPVSHPSTMMRMADFLSVGGYSKLKYVEDYDLWIKLYLAGYKIKNLNEDVLLYRIRRGAQKRFIKETIIGTLQCQRNAYKKIKPSFSDLCYHFALFCLLILPKPIIFKLFRYFELGGYKK